MKKVTPVLKLNRLISTSILTLIGVLAISPALADVVYVTSMVQGCTATTVCGNVNTNGTYSEVNLTLGVTGIKGTAPDRPVTPTASRAYLSGTSLTDTTAGVDIKPTLAIPGGVYQIDYNWNGTAGNASTNVILTVSSADGTLSTNSTPIFQRSFANTTVKAASWLLLGYITNNPNVTQPTISFRYESGEVNATLQNRLLFDCWRFTLVEPCLFVPTVGVTGPLATNLNEVVVTGVSSNATTVTVYQNSGSGMVQIGTKATGVTEGNNTVTVSGLVKGAKVAATQTIGAQQGCVPTAGTTVGGGPNPRVRAVFSIRETSSIGPVGEPGDTTSGNIHFLGASGVLSGSPTNGPVLNPSTNWQTLSLKRGNETVGDSANVTGVPVSGSGYAADAQAMLEVYAFRTIRGTNIYSLTAALSPQVTSNNTFNVNWSWDPVAGAHGYRLVWSFSNTYMDVSGNVTNFLDSGPPVSSPPVLQPNAMQTDTSVQWAPSANLNFDSLPGEWGILESINFAIHDLTDTGPYDLYIDNVQNGTTIFRDFEASAAGDQDVGFRNPGFSGSTGGNILSAPDISIVTDTVADTGTKSLRVRFQWSGTEPTKWLRLTTSGVGNPQVFLNDPISVRLLLLPAGVTPGVPTLPAISISRSGSDVILNWTGAHNLQAAPVVSGPYTNVPGVTVGPYTNSATDSQMFFRLSN